MTPTFKDLILYNNNQLIAVNKPSGIATQPDGSDNKSMQDLAEIYCKHPVQLVHRLDRPASGILLFAKNKKAVASLHKQFHDRTVEKTYLAIVGNKPKEEEGELIHQLQYSTNIKKSFIAEADEGKTAVMNYKLVGTSDRYFLLEIHLQTGRQHQIRTQLSAIGSPIRGDDKYGFKRGNKDRSIQLHALRLSFDHPVSKTRETIIAPLPDLPVWNAFNYQLED